MTWVRLTVPRGARFGRLVVLGDTSPYVTPKGAFRRRLLVACVCGSAPKPVRLDMLRSGRITSCGCHRQEVLRATRLKRQRKEEKT